MSNFTHRADPYHNTDPDCFSMLIVVRRLMGDEGGPYPFESYPFEQAKLIFKIAKYSPCSNFVVFAVFAFCNILHFLLHRCFFEQVSG